MKTVEPLDLNVRGSEGITFREGARTGDMTEYGVEIETVWFHNMRKRFGGCINREEAILLRDWLNTCIEKWESERVAA